LVERIQVNVAQREDGLAALDHDAIQRLSRDWSSRFILGGLPFLPLATIVFAWMFRDHAQPVLLGAWAFCAFLTAAGTYYVTRQYLNARAAKGDSHRWDLRQGPMLASIALVWGASPFVLEHSMVDVGSHTAALLFPLAVSVLLAVMTSPVRRLFAATLPFVLAPLVLWLLLSNDRLLHRMSLAAAGFGLLLVLLFRTVHRMMRGTVELGLRNEILLTALERDRAEVRQSNDLLGQANERLRHQALHDPLTGLLNRRGLLEQLEQDLTAAEIAGESLILMFCDLDRFKVINDSLGHAAGDQLLAIVSARLSDAFSTPHVLARLGGDEFVVVCVPSRNEDPVIAARRYCDRVRSTIGDLVDIEDHQLVVTASIGVAISPDHGTTSRDLLRHADAALHIAKDGGRNRSEVFDDSHRVSLARRVDDEQTVRVALDNGDFVPWYQPIVDARTGATIGAELLVRWLNDSGPPQPAASFIDLVSESGMVEQLSEQVIEQGLRDLLGWEAAGLPDDFRMSVNLPPRYMSRTGRVHRITSMLMAGPCHRLSVEVTESSVIDDLDFAERQLAELRALGMTVALDDFGTGSAPLTLLQRLPLDGVKIDRSFITDLGTEERDRALVRGFVSLARDLQLHVTAEGVESTIQQHLLLQVGCHRQQGYLHGAAMDAQSFAALLEAERLVLPGRRSA
jgi:diguanylate cyclase (GGDEF)-like protein